MYLPFLSQEGTRQFLVHSRSEQQRLGTWNGDFWRVEAWENWGFTLWWFNIAIENDQFLDVFPIKTSIYMGFSMAMLNNQMVPALDIT